MHQAAKFNDVLTLEEAAKFLRVTKKKLQAAVDKGTVPAQRVEEEWRFFKPTLEKWLSGYPKVDGKTAMLRIAGAFEGDETLAEIRAAAYKARGRSETE